MKIKYLSILLGVLAIFQISTAAELAKDVEYTFATDPNAKVEILDKNREMTFPLVATNGKSFTFKTRLSIEKMTHYGAVVFRLAGQGNLGVSAKIEHGKIFFTTQQTKSYGRLLATYPQLTDREIVLTMVYDGEKRRFQGIVQDDNGVIIYKTPIMPLAIKFNIDRLVINVQNYKSYGSLKYENYTKSLYFCGYTGHTGNASYAISGRIYNLFYSLKTPEFCNF